MTRRRSPCRRLRALLLVPAATLALAARGGGEPPPLSWLEVVPLDAQSAPQLHRYDRAEGLVPVAGASGAYALVCSGTIGWATGCTRLQLEANTSVPLDRRAGTRLAARLLAEREPVADAEIRVFPAALDARRAFVMVVGWDETVDRPVRSVRSDAEGRFELPPLAAGRYRLEIAAPWGRCEPSDEIEVPGPETLRRRRAPVDENGNALLDLGDLPLQRGLTVEYQVTDHTGRPLAGAEVGGVQPDAEHPFGLVGATDRQGRAVLAGAEPGLPFRARCTAQGHGPVDLDFPRPPDLVVCRLDAHAGVAGRIVVDGAPLPGARIELTERSFGKAERWDLGSDDDGRFVQRDLPAGSYRLSAAATGFAGRTQEIELSPGEVARLPEIELVAARERAGRVVDAVSGEPVAGAEVRSVAPAGAVATRSDADGGFVFHQSGSEPPSPGDSLTLRVTAAGYPPLLVGVPPERGDEDHPFEILLVRGGRLRVTLWDEDAEAPCAGCTVVAYRPLQPGVPAEDLPPLVTDAAGVAVSDLLPPGEYHVAPESVHSTGSSVEVRSGDVQRRARVLPDVVTEVAFGQPSTTLAVRLSPAAEGFSLLADGRRGRRTVQAADDGVFRLRRGAEEPLTLRLARPGLTLFATVVPADARADLDIELPRTRVRGTVAGGGEVRLRSLADPSVWAWTWAAADGGFVVPHLPPGIYAVELDGEGVESFALAVGDDLDLGTVGRPGSAAVTRR